MKIKPVFVGIAVLGALLLFLSLSTIAKVFAANPRDLLQGVKTQPEAVQLLPKKSPAFISFLAKPEKLGLFAQLAAKPSDRGDVRHELANLKQQLRQNWLLDYERDIQPWLDQEITLAVTDVDLDRQVANGLQTGYLLAFAVKDAELAQTTIDAFWQRLAVNGSDLGFEQYQGYSILNTTFSDDKPAIASTTLDKFVLFANDTRVLHQAIDNWKSPNLALTSLDDYRDRLAQINTGKNTGKFSVAYVNLAELDADLPKNSLLLSLGFDKSGVRAKTFWNSQPNPQPSALTETNSVNISSKSSERSTAKSNLNITTAIPASSSVIIGKNLDATLQNLKDSLPIEWQKVIAEAIAPLSLNTLNSNALAWAQDDYAIALSPNNSHTNQDWLIVAKVNDSKTTEAAIAFLDDLAKPKITVGEITLKSQPVTVWTKLSVDNNHKINNKNSSDSNTAVSGKIVAAHAQTSNYIYLSNSLTSLESALTLKNNQAIANSKSFKTISAKLPRDRQSYGYIAQKPDLKWLQANLSNITTNEILQKISNSSLASIINYVDTISFANTGSRANIENSEIFLSLK
jgi:hypothetical protein